jgi:1-acylglycerone phosphate reductase
MAVYNASKAAQHSLNETLRIELEPFGVRVINVVTGAIDTIIMTKGAAAGVEFQLPSTSLYQAIFDKIKGRAEGLEYVPRTSTAEYANVSLTPFFLPLEMW